MENKGRYAEFIKKVYTPIYSQPFWLDAVCGEDGWDVWLYAPQGEVLAAMPYYREARGSYSYITKALLTQNNGIIFRHAPGAKGVARQKFEEKAIEQACEFVKELGIDVYEQQYHYSFTNWLPFFWQRYTAVPRYTYVIEHTGDIDAAWENISSKYKNKIKKGQKNAEFTDDLTPEAFYDEHEKVFKKQGLSCPFSRELWERLYRACAENGCGKIICARTPEGAVASLMFLVWDEQSVYQLLAGSMPEYQSLDTYDALIWEGIRQALEMGLKYDFEGSVIKRISKSFREFGGEPKMYFRIRKVFNPEIIRQEAEKTIENL